MFNFFFLLYIGMFYFFFFYDINILCIFWYMYINILENVIGYGMKKNLSI